MWDTENEVLNRINALSGGNLSNNIDTELVNGLKRMLDDHNVLAQSFRWQRKSLVKIPLILGYI